MSDPQNIRSTLVPMLASGFSGLPLAALVADVIAADARFNAWFAVDGKRTLDFDAKLKVIEAYDGATLRCQAAVELFRSSNDHYALEQTLGDILLELQRKFGGIVHSLHSMLLPILASGSMGLSVSALAADVIAADDRFNAWFLVDGKRKLDDEAMLDVMDAYHDAGVNCHAAIEEHRSTDDDRKFALTLSKLLLGLKWNFGHARSLRSILMPLLACEFVDLKNIALLADVVAADAKFNDWIAVDGTRALDGRVIGAYQDATVRCQAAIANFQSSNDRRALEQALGDVLRELQLRFGGGA